MKPLERIAILVYVHRRSLQLKRNIILSSNHTQDHSFYGSLFYNLCLYIPLYVCVTMTSRTHLAWGEDRRPDIQVEQVWRTQSWDTSSGLPQSGVTSIAPTSDGRLWVGTFAGLSVFDGSSFEPLTGEKFTSHLQKITALKLDPLHPNTLWIGTGGNGLWRLEEGRSTHIPLPQPRAQGLIIYKIDIDKQSHLWVATDQGLFYQVTQREWRHLYPQSTFDVDVLQHDEAWICSIDRAIYINNRGELLKTHIPTSLTGSTSAEKRDTDPGQCRGGVVTPDGRYWASFERRLMIMHEEESPLDLAIGEESFGWMQSPYLDPQGRVWLPTRERLLLVGDWKDYYKEMKTQRRLLTRRSEPLKEIRATWAELNGPIWLGSTGQGLSRLTDEGFARIVHQNNDSVIGKGPVLNEGSFVWWGHNCQTLMSIDPNGQISEISLPLSSDHPCIDALAFQRADREQSERLDDDRAQDGADRILIARKGELLELDSLSGALLRRAPLRCDELPCRVSVIKPSEAHRDLWLAFRGGGIGRLSAEGELSWMTLPESMRGKEVLTIKEEADHTFFGHRGGVSIHQGGDWRHFTAESGLPMGPVRDLQRDDQGLLWVATYGGGLGWIEGDSCGSLYSPKGPLSERFISSLTQSPLGELWVHGNRGVSRLSLRDLHTYRRDALSPLNSTHIKIDEANGWLRPSSALLPSGKLWLAGVKHMSIINTNRPMSKFYRPAPIFLEARIGDQSLSFKTETIIQSETQRRLTVTFSAPDLTANTPHHYEHRLIRHDDLSNHSTHPWTSREHSPRVTYSYISPGTYQFQVRSIGEDSAFGETATLHFRILPRWSELGQVTGGLYGLGLGILLLFGWRRRSFVHSNVKDAAHAQGSTFKRQEVASHLSAIDEEITQGLELDHRLREYKVRLSAISTIFKGMSHEVNNLLCAFSGNLELINESISPDDDWGLECLEDLKKGVTSSTAWTDLLRSIGVASVDSTRVTQNTENTPNNPLKDANETLRDMQKLLSIIILKGQTLRLTQEGTPLVMSRSGLSLHEDDADPFDPAWTFLARQRRVRATALTLTMISSALGLPSEEITLSAYPQTESRGISIAVQISASISWSIDKVLHFINHELSFLGEVIIDQALYEPSQETYRNRVIVTLPPLMSDENKLISPNEQLNHLLSTALPALPSPLKLTPPTYSRDQRSLGIKLYLVDDHNELRRALSRHLINTGYEVIDFSDPRRALESIHLLDTPPDLLITDVIMPHMNGGVLASKALKHFPNMPVLFISGYTADVLKEFSQENGEHQLLRKPFSPQELVANVAQLTRVSED